MTIPHGRPPTWDDFVDLVLPWVGSAQLDRQLAVVAPALTAQERGRWVQRFNRANSAHQDRFADAVDWTEDEIDGVWYDAMKAVALAFLCEGSD